MSLDINCSLALRLQLANNTHNARRDNNHGQLNTSASKPGPESEGDGCQVLGLGEIELCVSRRKLARGGLKQPTASEGRRGWTDLQVLSDEFNGHFMKRATQSAWHYSPRIFSSFTIVTKFGFTKQQSWHQASRIFKPVYGTHNPRCE